MPLVDEFNIHKSRGSMMPFRKLSIAFAISLLLVFAHRADACSCLGWPTPCGAYQSASAVFIGYVTDVKLAEGPEWANIKYPPGTVYLRVEQSYKGVEETEVAFPQGTGGDCIPIFSKGQRWLIYAYRDTKNKLLHPLGCSRNSPVERASDDLMYLRNLASLANKTRLAGTIQHYDNIPGRGFEFVSNLADVKVSITDEQGRVYETFSDSNGLYEVIELPTGTYKVHADIPKNLKLVKWRKNDEKVELKTGSCNTVDFTFRSDAGISGRVIDSKGQEVAGIYVYLIRTEMIDKIGQWGIGSGDTTDEKGMYEFKEIPPGKYLIGINLDGEPIAASPYRRTFYPGVDSVTRATVIDLSEMQKRSNYDIHLPPRLATRTVEGIVVWSDGQPVTGGRVTVKNTDDKKNMKIGYADGKIDQQGHFTLTVLDGTKGWVHAYDDSGRMRRGTGMHYANPVKVEVVDNMSGIKLIIPLPDNYQKE